MAHDNGRGGPVLLAAHLLRIVAAGCVLLAGLVLGGIEAALFALVLLGLVLPWLLGAPAWLDLSLGVVLLVAAWSSVAGLYRSVSLIDVPVHMAATGLLAVLSHVVLTRVGALPSLHAPTLARGRLGAVVTITALGLALSVLWELGEWCGYVYLDDSILVGYDDTVGDLAAGGVGALVAGLAVAARADRFPARPEVLTRPR